MQKGKDYIGVGVGALIFNGKGEVLFMKRGPASRNERGHWEIPGGGVRFGETRAAAIAREVKEELGVELDILAELHTIDHMIPDEAQHWVATPFLAAIRHGRAPQILEPDKCEAVAWFAIDDLPSPLARSTHLTLAAYRYYQQVTGVAA